MDTKPKPNLIVMLTYDDVTVPNALEVFQACADLPVQHWGFKNVGLPVEEMTALVNRMKAAGKTTYLEVVTYDEASCLEAAKVAVDCKFDVLMGTLYYDSVHRFLKGHGITYSPFVGRVSGSPSILEGTNQEIIDDANAMIEKGITAFDILAYRHVADGEKLAYDFCKAVKAKVCIAGSIASYQRIDTMFTIRPWAFTMGSALFDHKFVPNTGVRENLAAVVQYMQDHT